MLDVKNSLRAPQSVQSARRQKPKTGQSWSKINRIGDGPFRLLAGIQDRTLTLGSGERLGNRDAGSWMRGKAGVNPPPTEAGTIGKCRPSSRLSLFPPDKRHQLVMIPSATYSG